MDTIIDWIVKIMQMISRILNVTDDGALSWIFGKGAELLDENKDKLTQEGE